MDQHRADPHPVVHRRAGHVGEARLDLAEAQAGLVAPAAEAAAARVVDPEQRASPRGVHDLAVEHGPPLVGEVGADEVAVVVVSGDAEAVPVLEGSGQGVEAEGLPRLTGRGVVAPVEHDRGAGRIADGARDPVHADVVVAVGHQQRDGLALLRGAEVEVGGRHGGVGVEVLARAVGAERAQHQPPAARRDGAGADLDVAHLAGQHGLVADVVLERLPGALLLLRLRGGLPRLPDQRGQHQQQQQGEQSLPGAEAAEELAAPVPSEQQEDHDRQQADRQAADGGRDSHVHHHAPHLVDLRRGVTGDEGVAVDELLDGADLGLAEGQRDPDRAHVADPEVGQDRPGLDDGIARDRGAYDGVVPHHDRGPAAGEEQEDSDGQAERHAQAHQHDAEEQPPRETHEGRRACEIA